jgi:flagellar hook-associated protein 3 FlgL
MYNLSLLNERNSKVTYSMSSGEALENGSDDASKYDYILGLQQDLKTYNAIDERVSNATIFNTASDSALSQIKSNSETILSEVIKANTSTTSDDDKVVIAEQISGYKDLLLNLANETTNGEYLFSGTNTTIQPFVIDEITGQVSYESDNSLKSLNVEKNKYVSQGVNGINIFYYTNETASNGGSLTFRENEIILDSDGNEWKLLDTNNDGFNNGLYLNGDESSTMFAIAANGDGTYDVTNTESLTLESKHSFFDDLDELINALNKVDSSGNSITSDEVNNLLNTIQDKLNTAYDSQNISHSIVGARTNNINTYQDIVQSKITNLTILNEEYASANLTALAIESQALENTYMALYSTINRVNKLSLVNYLG